MAVRQKLPAARKLRTQGHLVMKSVLVGATILMGLAVPAFAQTVNDIWIDASSNGSVKTLAITQDDANPTNQVAGNAAGTTVFPVVGPWKTISINQQGGTNLFYGSVASHSGSTTASLTASYTGGNNTQSLTIGGTTPPSNPSVTIAVDNTTGVSTNTITDTLDGSALTYNLAVTGTGNSVTNAVAATGAVTLAQGGGSYGITGDNNTVSNTVSGVATYTHDLTIAGSSNTVTNAASNGGDKSITQSITGDGNTVGMTLNGAGSQSAALTVDIGTTVDYTLATAAVGAAANINLSNVVGLGGIPAVVNVTQTAAADGATANVTISGGAYTMGSSLTGGAGVIIYQNSSGAILNMTTTANANGYTVHVTQ
jgi:hypothetical protein